MPVKANSGEISLADFLQIKGTGLGSCRVVVDAPAGPGVLAIVDGDFVWAEYDGLAGEPAAYSLLMLAGAFNYEMRGDIKITKRNMKVPCQRFLLSSLRFKAKRENQAASN